MKALKLLLLVFSIFILSPAAYAQWSCPSKMNAHLKPLWQESPLSWTVELESGGGILGERAMMNNMAFGGLELYLDNIEIYLEGGIKHWETWEDDLHLKNTMLGMREAYIGFHPNKSTIKLGVQSLQLNDQFIFNERALAASFLRQDKGISLQAAFGTVSSKVARNGSFCSKCYTYDIIQDKPKSYLAPDLFEEFFGAAIISLNPEKHKNAKMPSRPSSGDEFQSFDEFSSGDEFSSEEEFSDISSEASQTTHVEFQDYGALVYSEFGAYYPNPAIWAGLYTNITLPLQLNYKLEILFQERKDNSGIMIINSLERSFTSTSGYTDVNATFYYFNALDANATSALSYSNLFLGEVLRFDAIEMPLISLYAKHRFKGKGMSLKLQYASNTASDRLSEINLQFNKNFKKHIHLIATAGYLSGDAVEDYSYLGRVELRYTF